MHWNAVRDYLKKRYRSYLMVQSSQPRLSFSPFDISSIAYYMEGTLSLCWDWIWQMSTFGFMLQWFGVTACRIKLCTWIILWNKCWLCLHVGKYTVHQSPANAGHHSVVSALDDEWELFCGRCFNFARFASSRFGCLGFLLCLTVVIGCIGWPFLCMYCFVTATAHH